MPISLLPICATSRQYRRPATEEVGCDGKGMSSYVRIDFLVCEFQREFQREESRARQALEKAGKNDRKTGRGCLSWGGSAGYACNLLSRFVQGLINRRRGAVLHLRHAGWRQPPELKDLLSLSGMRPRDIRP